MRIVVTGATGNIGTALLRRWDRADPAAQPDAVVGVARRLPTVPGPLSDRTEWVSADLSREDSAPVLRRAFRGADAVVHLAWGFQPSHKLAYLEALGVGGTSRVLDAVAAAGVPHLVHLSSLGAYSPKEDDEPVDETWPTGGVPSSPYSRHKAAAERLLDEFEASGTDTVVTRLRPGIVGQRDAGSALLRYGIPGWLPARALDVVPVLPVDRGLVIPMVHSDDVAAAVTLVLEQRAGGAFNLAAEPPLTRDTIASVLGARGVHVPSALVRAAVSASWHARVQQLDPGWIDLAFALPLLDSTKARRELGWEPTRDAVSVLREAVDGMRDTASGPTPVLRRRTVLGNLRAAAAGGPVFRRERP
jgi:nucleoside-diphosphate-sugar epimerase